MFELPAAHDFFQAVLAVVFQILGRELGSESGEDIFGIQPKLDGADEGEMGGGHAGEEPPQGSQIGKPEVAESI